MTYEMRDKFGIDDGELDTLTQVQAFTLGVEWCLIREMAQRGDEFHAHPVHPDNSRRLERMLSACGYHQQWDHRDDWSFVTASTVAPE